MCFVVSQNVTSRLKMGHDIVNCLALNDYGEVISVQFGFYCPIRTRSTLYVRTALSDR